MSLPPPVSQDSARIDFGEALSALRSHYHVARDGWNGKGMYLGLQEQGGPSDTDPNTLPYLWLRTVDGKRVPWLASQTDLLADDWCVVELAE